MNNRQNGRRGRGRGNNGMRPMGGGGGQDRGNRIDNRARGNANQLHEKYKTLARDAQMQGDRVLTEYYNQFADHYFRVLAETRGRFEEQRRQRPDFDDQYDGEDGEGGEDGGYDEQPRFDRRPEARDGGERQERSERQDRPERQDRYERQDRQDRPERQDRQPRFERRDGYRDGPREERPQAADDRGEERAEAGGEARPRRPRRERSVEAPRHANGEAAAEAAPRLEGDRLPAFLTDAGPAPALPEAANEPTDEPARPRRGRPRRPRADEVAVEA